MTANIADIMQATATSLRYSLDFYWPSDAAGRNDLNERNLSLHYSHVMLSRGYGVFAEAHYPTVCEDATYLDILAIAPAGEHFLVGEFKKHAKVSGMTASSWDVDRILKFDLHRGLTEPKWSKQRVEIATNCLRGIGLIGGLKWSANRKPPRMGGSGHEKFAARILSLGGTIDSVLVRENPLGTTRGGYYLQFASFPIPRLTLRP